jgi:hypothetical protein
MPYIYNIDHYTVFENFIEHPLYLEALKVAQVEKTIELDEFVQDHVFVVGPYRDDNHWVQESEKKGIITTLFLPDTICLPSTPLCIRDI